MSLFILNEYKSTLKDSVGKLLQSRRMAEAEAIGYANEGKARWARFKLAELCAFSVMASASRTSGSKLSLPTAS
jgi:hypothetical protein